MVEQSGISIAEPDAKVGTDAAIWPIGLCVLLCWAIFFWASGRGFEFSDEAFDLISISNPGFSKAITNFGDLWHPLYVAVNGDIATFRVAGMVLLSACGALFGLAISRFIEPRVDRPSERFATVLGIAVCVFWQHQTWDPTPDYNMLNLCALLLFFSGLLESVSLDRDRETRAASFVGLLGPVLLCAASLTIMALTKASTAVSAIALGAAWTVLLRPPRPILSLALTALLSLGLLVFAATLIDGSISDFVAVKMQALDAFKSPDGNGDLHGIAASVVGVFAKQWWKVAEAVSFASILLCLGLIWSWLITRSSQTAQARGYAYFAVAAIGLILLWSRVEDLQIGQTFMGFRVWRLPLALVLLALAARVAFLTRFRLDRQQRRIAFAAVLITLAPASYSIGTDNLLIWHMAGAGIFWAAAMMLLTKFVSPQARQHARRAAALLCSAATLALLVGVVIAPGRIGLPLWEQTVTTPIGPEASLVAVTPAAAAYIGTFRQAAHDNGFTLNTPVVDLSEMGVGLTFALGGKPLGSPFWLISDGGIPDETERRETIRAQAASALRFLAVVPPSELCRAWVITGSPDYFPIVQTVMSARGIRFPEDYRAVGRASRADLGWEQVLWKPRSDLEPQEAGCGAP